MSVIAYETRDHDLILRFEDGSSRTLHMKSPVQKVLELSDRFVVLTSPPAGQIDNSNVIAIDKRGEISWRIVPRAPEKHDSPYTGIDLVEGQLRIYNWDGYEVTVDPVTGKVIDERWRR